MEVDKVHTHSIERSGTLAFTDREAYAPKEKKTLKLGHGHHRPHDSSLLHAKNPLGKRKSPLVKAKKS
jgi:hypothetical protein